MQRKRTTISTETIFLNLGGANTIKFWNEGAWSRYDPVYLCFRCGEKTEGKCISKVIR